MKRVKHIAHIATGHESNYHKRAQKARKKGMREGISKTAAQSEQKLVAIRKLRDGGHALRLPISFNRPNLNGLLRKDARLLVARRSLLPAATQDKIVPSHR